MNAVDTNVLIYTCDESDPHRQRIAHELVSATAGGILPWQVACEFIAASRKLARQGFSPTDAWARLEEFLAVFQLAMPGPSVLDTARDLHVNRQWSFWDAMLVAACLDAGVTRLYSEDLPGQSSPPGLEIVNPFA